MLLLLLFLPRFRSRNHRSRCLAVCSDFRSGNHDLRIRVCCHTNCNNKQHVTVTSTTKQCFDLEFSTAPYSWARLHQARKSSAANRAPVVGGCDAIVWLGDVTARRAEGEGRACGRRTVPDRSLRSGRSGRSRCRLNKKKVCYCNIFIYPTYRYVPYPLLLAPPVYPDVYFNQRC